MLLKILLGIVIYITGYIISYSITLPYFEYLIQSCSFCENIKIEKAAKTIALFSFISVLAMFTIKDFKYCGMKFKRSKNGNNKRS